MPNNTFNKDPDAALDYEIDWSTWLGDTDTLSTSTWAVSDSAIVIDSSLNTTTTATVILSAGLAGYSYKVTNSITTASGLSDDRSLTINVVNK